MPDDSIYSGPPGSGIDIINAHGLNWPRDRPRVGVILLPSGDPWTDLRNHQEVRALTLERGWPLFQIGELTIPSPEEQQQALNGRTRAD